MGPVRSIWRFLAALQAVCVCCNGDQTTCSLFLLEDIVFPHVFPCWRILGRDPLAVLLCVQRAHVCACVPESWRSGKGETNIIRSVNHGKSDESTYEREGERACDRVNWDKQGGKSVQELNIWISADADAAAGKEALKKAHPCGYTQTACTL